MTSNTNWAHSLTIVGTGMQLVGQMTFEARAHMQQADKLLHLVADPATSLWIESLNPSAESLQSFYETGKDRRLTYQAMVERILTCVRTDGHVVVAFYGHPGVFVNPAHEAIRRAREEGYSARMLPGVSAEDCLFADLGVDPGWSGCQSFETTDFLVHGRRFDPTAGLVLWQIGAIGELRWCPDRNSSEGLTVLTEVLARYYDPSHCVTVYEASSTPALPPRIETQPLSELPRIAVSSRSTLYVPPADAPVADIAMLHRLGLTAAAAGSQS